MNRDSYAAGAKKYMAFPEMGTSDADQLTGGMAPWGPVFKRQL